MSDNDNELEEQLADARAQIEALQAAAAGAEARAATARDEVMAARAEHETVEEIDREFEAAQRVVGQLREKIEREAVEQARAARVPPGAPARRGQDVSSLSPGEKIKLGLQRLDRTGH